MLKTLKGLSPYEFIFKQWTIEPERFTINPIHRMPGLNTERRVPPSWIIEPIDILEYSPFRLVSCFPTIAPDELCLDGFEEREEVQERPQWGVSPMQDHAIVIAITFAAHRHFEAVLFQAFLVVM
jgi:hypothetical protein